jgi:hypothetical protein
MTLEEWTTAILTELRAAGFQPTTYQGFPLLKRPEGYWETIRLLKFHTSLPCDRRIYAEGMLFVPAGAWAEAERLERENSAET